MLSRGRTTSMALAVAGVLAMLTGCVGGATSVPPTHAPSSTRSAFAIDQDFPDPDVMLVDGTYYAYATNVPGINEQVATSRDLKTWKVSTTDALPDLPGWTSPGKTWAPDVSELSPGHFVMYFVAANVDPAAQCINVATSTSPIGPFTAVGTAALVCPPDQGGAIDPATFTDGNGARYLVWKNDGNCCGLDTWLQITPLAADGLTVTGPSTKLIKQTQSWEGNLVEAPTLVKHGTRFVLFYSANDYSGSKYAIGYATASSLLGPYTKHKQPLLSTASSGGRFTGPGGQDVVTTPDGRTVLVFHSWAEGSAYRGMDELPLDWKNDEPVVKLPAQ
jgi:beta-xylosidase